MKRLRDLIESWRVARSKHQQRPGSLAAHPLLRLEHRLLFDAGMGAARNPQRPSLGVLRAQPRATCGDIRR